MRIWVIGASGMLGSAIYKELKQRTIECIGSCSTKADVTSLESLFSFSQNRGITHIINCSGYTKVDLAEKETGLAYAINVKGVQNISVVAEKLNAKIIHFSTDYVFDGEKGFFYNEEAVCSPCNVYGQTKFEAEKYLLEKNRDACIIRTSWLFGLNGKNFVVNMIQQMQEKKEILVVDDQFGRPTMTKDLAKAAISLLPETGIFHFANSGVTNWYEFAKTIYDIAKNEGFNLICEKIVPIKTTYYPMIAKRPLHSVLETQKFEKNNKKPRMWQEALEEYIKEYFQSLWQ